MTETKLNPLNWLLLADGPSDRALLPVIGWTLHDLWQDGTFAKPVFIPRKHETVRKIVDEILRDYRPDLLFVHRDAKSAPPGERRDEIPCDDTTIPIIPVKMTEAWLLIDESALRHAAGNPNGKMPLSMPSPKQLEHLPDPKDVLHNLLRQASGYQKRRLKKFNVPQAVQRLANLIVDYTTLHQLTAYVDFRKYLDQSLCHLQHRFR